MSEDCEVEVKVFSFFWYYFETDLVEFVVKFLENEQMLKIEGKGEFAFFMGHVIKLKTCPIKRLVITDQPFYVQDDYECQEYFDWIRCWIENYQFNGSKLVYAMTPCTNLK